ncbi:MAG TPA: hypothetical protein VKQ30_10950 [Ktedonobacterales bacterium]|nr:hypothetical protein [Ktedonobacterales bacterium]
MAGVTAGAPGAVAPVQATIDPSLGGSLTSADGALTVEVTAGEADTLSMSLVLLPPTTDGSLPPGNLKVGGQMYALAVTDSAGNTVTVFDPQLSLVVNPTPYAATGGDMDQFTVSVLDPGAGTFVDLQPTMLDDGRVLFAVAELATVPELVATETDATEAEPLIAKEEVTR